jgi:hypothetical protein
MILGVDLIQLSSRINQREEINGLAILVLPCPRGHQFYLCLDRNEADIKPPLIMIYSYTA